MTEEEKKVEEIIENKEISTSIPFVNTSNKEGKAPISSGKKKEGSFLPIILITIASLIIATCWDKFPIIKDAVHKVLDPSAGMLLKLGIPYGLEIGMLIVVFTITLITTVIQKFATDQKALKELKAEQKILQEEMQKFKDHPEKMAELSKKKFQFIPRTMKLTSRAGLFTGIPFILFFRWFYDVFALMGQPKFFGFLPWFWFYLIFTMVFSSLLRKWMKVV